jgi:hypothetical protein
MWNTIKTEKESFLPAALGTPNTSGYIKQVLYRTRKEERIEGREGGWSMQTGVTGGCGKLSYNHSSITRDTPYTFLLN